ncbi:hypothetical protein LTR08_008693 [Meristemomyces frigidus]|nr:hypothetical protein LTR08_008693 [Meristemomyces frigidus]
MSSRTRLSFTTTLTKANDKLTIQISDPSALSADNLALATWGSSEVLANILHRFTPDFSSTGFPESHTDNVIPVLELGAGTGLVGLSAACVWGVGVVLTDLPPLVGALGANIAMNAQVLGRCGGAAGVGMLDWYSPERMSISNAGSDSSSVSSFSGYESSRARVILAADTVYSEEHPELLVNVVVSRLEKGKEARLIVCYPLRVGYLDHIRDLWARLEGAGLVCGEEGREQIDGSWDEDTPYEWCVWGWGSGE